MKSAVKWKGSVGAGWEPIVEPVLEDIEDHGGWIMQVKEKFGGRRIYTQGGDLEYITDVIHDAEAKAAVTCEECGQPGVLQNNRRWLKTLCTKCNEELK